MQGNHLFEYAVIRVVPRVEREEFLNVGVVLYCRQMKFLRMMYSLDEVRLHAFCASLDVPELQSYLAAFEKICNGEKDGGPIARLDIASRFRWLTAMRSTVVQTSRVHPGLNGDPQAALTRLYEQLVL
ncbi:DUF3037 domain-containing protein [Chitinophaga cymbidii]|uniref:DUF3037 domain-containing protein n=1 Tax=Chitinophaga cymbidii TaxID=1096750 RepID=A0A512RFI8_9BACT|nr:DUF3037 domain-containing protein [Chitinophaga cymbidii]GEP94465.1 hypothetical protein CCY01nite_07250 [Chitinophaga cymbidii]